jgi:hypothetical protein
MQTIEWIEFQKQLINKQVWRTCLNCEFWHGEIKSKHQQGCSKFNNVIPPFKVVVSGCAEWEGEIPF